MELGAGYGYVANSVAARTRLLVTIDPDSKRVQHMHQVYSKLDCVVAVGEAIPIRNSVFEKAYAKKSIHHLTDLVQALRELNRILKPTGSLVVQELKSEGQWRFIDWIERKIRKVQVNFLAPEALATRLEEAGFSVKSLESKGAAYYLVGRKSTAIN